MAPTAFSSWIRKIFVRRFWYFSGQIKIWRIRPSMWELPSMTPSSPRSGTSVNMRVQARAPFQSPSRRHMPFYRYSTSLGFPLSIRGCFEPRPPTRRLTYQECALSAGRRNTATQKRSDGPSTGIEKTGAISREWASKPDTDLSGRRELSSSSSIYFSGAGKSSSLCPNNL